MQPRLPRMLPNGNIGLDLFGLAAAQRGTVRGPALRSLLHGIGAKTRPSACPRGRRRSETVGPRQAGARRSTGRSSFQFDSALPGGRHLCAVAVGTWLPGSFGPPAKRSVQGGLNYEDSPPASPSFSRLVKDISGDGEGNRICLVESRIVVLAVDEQGYRKQAGLALGVDPQDTDGAHASTSLPAPCTGRKAAAPTLRPATRQATLDVDYYAWKPPLKHPILLCSTRTVKVFR